MSTTLIVTGTDTDVGKTVFCAGLTRLLDGVYWKPVQAGLDGESDSESVQRLSGLPKERILPEGYRLRTPVSPHWAAECDGITIEQDQLALPVATRPLIVEGAGGLLVPLTRRTLQVDLFARWGAPVVLCARTRLGTINHTLLSLEALRRRGITVIGVAFIGDSYPETERIIGEVAAVRVLGRLPRIEPLSAEELGRAFGKAFAAEAFVAAAPALS